MKTSLSHQRTRYLKESKGCVLVIPISSGRYQQLNRSNLIYMSAFSSFMYFRILPEVSWNVHTLHTGAIARRFISRQSHICLCFETKFSVLRLDVATSSQGRSCHVADVTESKSSGFSDINQRQLVPHVRITQSLPCEHF